LKLQAKGSGLIYLWVFHSLDSSAGREKDVQVIDLSSVMKKCEVIAMDGGYVENAGAVFYRLTGDEHSCPFELC